MELSQSTQIVDLTALCSLLVDTIRVPTTNLDHWINYWLPLTTSCTCGMVSALCNGVCWLNCWPDYMRFCGNWPALVWDSSCKREISVEELPTRFEAIGIYLYVRFWKQDLRQIITCRSWIRSTQSKNGESFTNHLVQSLLLSILRLGTEILWS